MLQRIASSSVIFAVFALLLSASITPSTARAGTLVYMVFDVETSVAYRSRVRSVIESLPSELRGTDTRFFFHILGLGSHEAQRFETSPRDASVLVTELSDDISDQLQLSGTRFSLELETMASVVASMPQDPDSRIGSLDRLIVLMFTDGHYVDPSRDINSSDGFLGDGWLTSPSSPFVRDFLSKNTDALKNGEVMIFTETRTTPFLRRGQENFYRALFEQAGATLYYLGPLYAETASSRTIADGLMERLVNRSLNPIPRYHMRTTDLLQIVTNAGTRRVEGY